MDFDGTLLFVFISSSDSVSSLILFGVVPAIVGGFLDELPAFEGGLPVPFEVVLMVAFDGGLELFAFGFSPSSSSSSEANGSSSTFFFLSCSLGLVFGFEMGSAGSSPLSSSILTSVSSFLDFPAPRVEKNSSLSCCWKWIRQVRRSGRNLSCLDLVLR